VKRAPSLIGQRRHALRGGIPLKPHFVNHEIVALVERLHSKHLRKESGNEKLYPDDQRHQRQIEERLFRDVAGERHLGKIQRIHLVPEDLDSKDKSNGEGKDAERTEKVHRFLAKAAHKSDGQQIEKAVDKSLQSEFRTS